MTPELSLTVVADVGGTNTRTALAHGGEVDAASIRRFRNAEHSGLDEVLKRFLGDAGVARCDGACVAMAGPVMDGVGRLTNLEWEMTREDLAACTGAEVVSILNDLQAQGHAMDHIAGEKQRVIIAGPEAKPHDAKLVVGCGTGFNAVPVFRTDTGRYVPPCESGHVTLPVLSDDDVSLARHVTRAHGFPGVEDVLSGRGFERCYTWASGTDTHLPSSEIMAALEAGDPVATKAARAFVTALGRVMGDLALTHLPFGGIYVIGGMARALTPYFPELGFDEAFRSKGRFSDFMDRFAVWGVEDDYAALVGCAQHIRGLMVSPAERG
ncbi:ROK family protein [Palleronia sp. LCG004]|uniref:glucokinase n=1 Tax=Palleronia sp. LCG004 TaxID=3079304 RepID=UPI0029428E64|nr:ROK family protein [Palleronia sp. LCG004]WOI57258.1 ROK family protein [Palleronia sp. LCG004]